MVKVFQLTVAETGENYVLYNGTVYFYDYKQHR